jgi:hypothetical protein
MYSVMDNMAFPMLGFPIRRSPDHSLLTATRSLSQSSTSFIGNIRLGIHLVPLSTFLCIDLTSNCYSQLLAVNLISYITKLLNNCTLSEAHISLHHQFDVRLSAFQISVGQLIYPTTLTSICPEVIVVIFVIKRNLHDSLPITSIARGSYRTFALLKTDYTRCRFNCKGYFQSFNKIPYVVGDEGLEPPTLSV